MKTPQAAINAYLSGDLNFVELLIELGRLAEIDSAGCLLTIPDMLLDELVKPLDEFPRTEADWLQQRVCGIVSWDRRVSQEVSAKFWREQARFLRQGVERMRDALADRLKRGEG